MSTNSLLEKIDVLAPLIGNTPLLKLPYQGNVLYHKIEAFNSWRSAKDRPAFNILRLAIQAGEITPQSTIVESSSGNFAISLAGICKFLGLKFIAVVDPNINEMNERILSLVCHEVVKVKKRDPTGGFLLTRLEMVHKLCRKHPFSFWPNQYGNVNNPMAYYTGMGDELKPYLDEVDHVFAAVSTGGAMKGISMRVKKENPSIVVHAVDVEGSVIFNNVPRARRFSGLGSSMQPEHLKDALIDEVSIVSEDEIVAGCHELLSEFALFCGASSGAVMAAVSNAIKEKGYQNQRILCILADSGLTYMESVFSPAHEISSIAS